MTFTTDIDLGEIVYLITDKEQLPRMVTAVEFSINGATYKLSQCTSDSYHYRAEIAKEQDIIQMLK
jgi:hypothetical protein